MRIIKEIIYNSCKVSIFYINQKYIIKFEQGNLEQTYKLSEIDFIIGDLNQIEKIIEHSLYESSLLIFSEMKDAIYNASVDLI